MIREAGADQAVLTIKSLEAFARAADGKATKIIIPSDIQGIAGLAASLKAVAEKDSGAAGSRDISKMLEEDPGADLEDYTETDAVYES